MSAELQSPWDFSYAEHFEWASRLIWNRELKSRIAGISPKISRKDKKTIAVDNFVVTGKPMSGFPYTDDLA